MLICRQRPPWVGSEWLFKGATFHRTGCDRSFVFERGRERRQLGLRFGVLAGA